MPDETLSEPQEYVLEGIEDLIQEVVAPGESAAVEAPKESAAPPPVASTPVRAAEPVKPKAPRSLVRLAVDLGMSQEKAESMEVEALDESVQMLRESYLRMSQQFQRPATDSQVPQPLYDSREEPKRPASEDAWLDDPAEVDPRVGKLVKELREEVAALKKKQGETEMREQHRELQTREQQVNQLFDGLGDDYAGWFGRGEIEMGGAEFHRRVGVLTAVGNQVAGRQVTPAQFKKLFEQTAKLMAPQPAAAVAKAAGEATEVERETLENRAREYERGALGRQGSRPRPASREQRAFDAMQAVRVRDGISVNGQAREEDFLD